MNITLITAVDPDRDDHLSDTAASVDSLRQFMSVQWIVVWDGNASRPVPDASVVLEGRAGSGIACTRNLALPFIASPFVAPLDADDLIEPAGANIALAELLHKEEIDWIGLSRTFLDGTPTHHSVRDTRSFEPGGLAESWTAPFPFHPNSVVVRSKLLRLAGGWPAIATNEDLGMILRVSELGGGKMIPDVLTHYRVWEKQEVARADYPVTKQLAFAYIMASLNELRASLGRASVSVPINPGGAFGRLELGTQ